MERRGSANNLSPSATFSAVIGLLAGTAGSGNPRGNRQAYGVAAAAVPTSSANKYPRHKRPRMALPGGAGAFAGESRRLGGDGAAFAHPGGERLEGCAIDTARIAAMLAHPG